MARQFWVKTSRGIAGPFSGEQLRRAAAQGRLEPDHQLSNDRKRWVPAAKVKGLRFAEDKETPVSPGPPDEDARQSVGLPHGSGENATRNRESATTTILPENDNFREQQENAASWFAARGFPRPMQGHPKEANWFWDMSIMAFEKGLWREAWAGFHLALSLFAEQGRVPDAARCLWRLGTTYKRLGANELSRDCLAKSLQMNRSLGNQEAVAVLLYELGEAHALCNDPKAAVRTLREAVEHPGCVDPEARQSALRLLESLDRGGESEKKAAFLLLREAEVREKAGDLEPAARLYTEAVERAVEQGDQRTAGDAGYFGHDVLLKLGRKEGAANLLRASVGANRKLGRKYEAGAGLARLGRVLLELGEIDQARNVFQECLAVLHEAGAPKADLDDVRARLERLGPVAQPQETASQTSAGAYLFDWSRISAGEYGHYVFERIVRTLSSVKASAIFWHGDICALNAKELAQGVRSHHGQLMQARSLALPTPLVEPDAEFPESVYLVGVWTQQSSNLDLLHKTLDSERVQGYIGHIAPPGGLFSVENWNHLMRKQLHLIQNVEIQDGSVMGSY